MPHTQPPSTSLIYAALFNICSCPSGRTVSRPDATAVVVGSATPGSGGAGSAGAAGSCVQLHAMCTAVGGGGQGVAAPAGGSGPIVITAAPAAAPPCMLDSFKPCTEITGARCCPSAKMDAYAQKASSSALTNACVSSSKCTSHAAAAVRNPAPPPTWRHKAAAGPAPAGCCCCCCCCCRCAARSRNSRTLCAGPLGGVVRCLRRSGTLHCSRSSSCFSS